MLVATRWSHTAGKRQRAACPNTNRLDAQAGNESLDYTSAPSRSRNDHSPL